MNDEGHFSSTTEADDWLPPADEFIGRDEELSRFAAILQRRQPALILLTGDIGVGKSTLLQQVRARMIAQQHGWAIVPPDLTDELSIQLDTSEEEFGRQVLEWLKIPTDQLLLESKSPESPLNALVEQLRSHAPVLLIIDGYRPALGFIEWFVKHFLSDIKKTGAAILVVVSSERDHVDLLVPLADEIVQLEPLDRNVIRQRLENIGSRINPPMDSAELEAYVTAVRDKPNLLRSLTSVLRLAQTTN